MKEYKTSKFLLCYNPLLNNGREYILHNRNPKIFAEVFIFNIATDQEEINKIRSSLNVGSYGELGNKCFVLAATWINSDNTDMYDEKTAKKLAGIMRRMADWYISVLSIENEDEDILD